MVANRLKKFLIQTIPDSQSAFLSGRLIYDNILVAFETLHYLKRKTTGKLGYMTLKLDMSKAYDRVEWEFLEKIMHHLGLDEKMIRIIMSCMKSVSYSVLLNGQPVGLIKPSRGLRQGDPLSPIYFYYVPWAYKVYSRKLKLMMITEVWLFVEMGLGFPIYFLQMIACFLPRYRS